MTTNRHIGKTHMHTQRDTQINMLTIKLKNIVRMWSQIDGIKQSLVKMKLIKTESANRE